MQRFKWTHHRFTRVAFAAFAVLGVVVGGASAAQSKPKPTVKPSAAKLDIMLMQPAATTVKSGDNQFEVMVKGADGKAIEKADVSVLFVMPPMGAMAEMRNEVKLKPAGGGKLFASQIIVADPRSDHRQIPDHGRAVDCVFLHGKKLNCAAAFA